MNLHVHHCEVSFGVQGHDAVTGSRSDAHGGGSQERNDRQPAGTGSIPEQVDEVDLQCAHRREFLWAAAVVRMSGARCCEHIIARVAAAGGEIPALAPLLDTIDLDAAIVTADALHIQHDHARYLRSRGAHYLATEPVNAIKAGRSFYPCAGIV